jgi:hypothetical protein
MLPTEGEPAFPAEVARGWGHLFPHLPCQSEANRRTRWLWGAFEQLRLALAAWLPEDGCQQVDTSAGLGAHRVVGQQVADSSCSIMSANCERRILPGPRRNVLSWAFAATRSHLADTPPRARPRAPHGRP